MQSIPVTSRRLSAMLAIDLLAALCFMATAARAETPELMQGKETLYQRVLLRDATEGRDGPDGQPVIQWQALQPLYVYERGGGWLRVAPGDAADRTFWITEEDAIDWRQNIVVTFDGAEGLGRLLFFADEDAAYRVIEAEDPALAAEAMRAEAEQVELGGVPSEQVVALGPATTIDPRANPYVMPILSSEEAMFDSGPFVNLLEVAVARARPQGGGEVAAEPGGGGTRDDYRAGIAFVVDTTISMQPYIEATRAALEGIYDQITGSDVGGAVSFGLVGYRDNLEPVPDLEYAARTFVDLPEGTSREAFVDGISRMTEARAPSKGFREDSYFGVATALSDIDWSPFAARFIVLVTDAGPRESGDPLSQTGLSARGLSNLVTERIGGAVAVLHLRTPAGAADHDSAQTAYGELARRDNQPALYFPIVEGDRDAYRAAAGELAGLIVEQVRAFRERTSEGVAPGERGTAIPDASARAGADADMRQAIRSATRTMELAYLGRQTGVEAPDVFRAFVADRDFARTGLKPLSVRLLLTKNQLSDLEQALDLIVEESEASILTPDKFFDEVLAAASDMSRRPEHVAARGDQSLADAALISEYLEGLPYRSQIMKLTRDRWISMHTYEQEMIMNDIHDKIERYRRYNAATDQWVDFAASDEADQGADASTLVYPMLLDDLP